MTLASKPRDNANGEMCERAALCALAMFAMREEEAGGVLPSPTSPSIAHSSLLIGEPCGSCSTGCGAALMSNEASGCIKGPARQLLFGRDGDGRGSSRISLLCVDAVCCSLSCLRCAEVEIVEWSRHKLLCKRYGLLHRH